MWHHTRRKFEDKTNRFSRSTTAGTLQLDLNKVHKDEYLAISLGFLGRTAPLFRPRVGVCYKSGLGGCYFHI